MACSWLQWCREAICLSYEGSPCPSGNREPSGGGSEVHRLQEAHIFYVGLDIHDKRIAISVFSESGTQSHPEVRRGALQRRGRE
jgi:hypothetical protein